MKVAVCLPSHGSAFRKHERCLGELRRRKPSPDWEFLELSGVPNLGHARAKLTRDALVRVAGVDVVLFIDADMTFSVETCEVIAECASRLDAVVGCVYAQKKFGGNPQVKFLEGTTRVTCFEGGGLHPAEWVGFGLTAISAKVLRALWATLPALSFEGEKLAPMYSLDFGDPRGDMPADDESFCRRIRALGFEVLADTRHRVGHLGEHEFFLEDNAVTLPRMGTGETLVMAVSYPKN